MRLLDNIRAILSPVPAVPGQPCPKCHAARLAHYELVLARQRTTAEESGWPPPEAPVFADLAAHDRRVHG